MGYPERERYAAMFAATYEPVLAYCLRRADLEGAEEAVAETFIVAWRRFDSIPDDPLPWLFSVARKVLANQRRTAERAEDVATRFTLEVRSRLERTVDPEERVIEREAAGEALERLTPEDTEILRLVAWEGLSIEQAAKAMGMTREQFDVRLHRARRRLERELRNMEGRPRPEGESGTTGGEAG